MNSVTRRMIRTCVAFFLFVGIAATSHAMQYVSDADWSTNADQVLHFKRDAKHPEEFVSAYTRYTAALLVAYAQADASGNRSGAITTALALHLNTKLIYQYVVRHKDRLRDQIDSAQKMTLATWPLVKKYIGDVHITDDLAAFRMSLADDPELRLNSL